MSKSNRHNIIKICFSLSLLMVSLVAEADSIVIKNANIFDGTSKELKNKVSVLVVGNKIKSISKNIAAPKGATIIDAKGKTLIPGLIDAHWHTMFSNASERELLSSDFGYLTALLINSSTRPH